MSIAIVASSAERPSREIAAIRQKLPKETALWAGGAGSPSLKGLPPKIEILASLDDLDRALTDLAD